MRIYIFALFFIFFVHTGIKPVSAQIDMCESIQNHIKKAKSIGGDAKARQKITQILEARNYLKKSISEAELVRCILLSGMDPNFIMAEAVKAGIPNQVVQVIYVQYNMSLPPEKRSPINLVSPVKPEVEKAEPVADAGDVLTLDMIAKDTTEEGGVSSGPGCNQISPWTWCAY